MTEDLPPSERSELPGASPPTITITSNGRQVECRPGQSIASALIESGLSVWRTTPSGAGRGLFCGIGVCFDCLVELNGVPSVRACLARAEPGDEVHWAEPSLSDAVGEHASGGER